jgi:hypothetical protein
LAEEAFLGEAASLRKLGRIAEERAVLEGFVKRYPKSVHFQMARGRLDELENITRPRGSVSNPAGAGASGY